MNITYFTYEYNDRKVMVIVAYRSIEPNIIEYTFCHFTRKDKHIETHRINYIDFMSDIEYLKENADNFTGIEKRYSDDDDDLFQLFYSRHKSRMGDYDPYYPQFCKGLK